MGAEQVAIVSGSRPIVYQRLIGTSNHHSRGWLGHIVFNNTHSPKKGTGTRKACCSYRLATPCHEVYCVKNTRNT